MPENHPGPSGTPPTPSSPGWFDDPEDPTRLRYFDGVVWSRHTESKAPPKRPEPTPTPQPYAGGLPYQSPGQSGQQAGQQPPPTGGWQGPGPQAPGTPPPNPYQPGQGSYQQGPYQQGPSYPSAPGASAPYGQPPAQPGGPAYPRATWVSGPTTTDGVPLAGFAQRLGAFLLDWAIQGLLGLLLGGYFLFQAMSSYLDAVDGMLAEAEGGTAPDMAQMSRALEQVDVRQLAMYTVVSIAVFVAYQYLFLVRGGQTPGKMLVGISVRSADQPGPPSSATVMRRLALPVALFLLALVPLVSYLAQLARALDLLFPAWDGKRQALHDRVAGTVVVVGKQERGPDRPH